jgi:RNA 2',3'-cyclic 3'-phosphodiesterase
LVANDSPRIEAEQKLAVIRAFIAVSIDSKVIARIADATLQLKGRLPGVNWVAEENLHLTLKFLGQIDEARIEPINRALEAAVRPFSRFTISAKGLGVFPGPKRPRVLWVGLDGGEVLIALAFAVETALDPVGFSVEARSFKPHLTIGRWRDFKGSATRLAREIEKWKSCEFGESEVKTVTLFQSVLKREGAVYHPLHSIALTAERPL